MLTSRTDGQFVEIDFGASYETTELRTLFETIRDDPGVPDGALLLFDASSRTEVLSEDLVRARLDMYSDILRARVAPVFAAIVSSATVVSGQTVQREAASIPRCTGAAWTMRQFAGFGTAEETNERFRFLLEHGQTGLSTAFDMPTLMGLDSDDARSLGEVGREGVAVDSLEDMGGCSTGSRSARSRHR